MLSAKRRLPRTLDIWPGYVDALSALLMLVIFLLMVFTAAQVFLSRIVTDQDSELSQLEARVQEIQSLFDDSSQENHQLRDVMEMLSSNLAELELEQQRLSEDRDHWQRAHGQLEQQFQGVQANLQALVPQALSTERTRLDLVRQLRSQTHARAQAEQQQTRSQRVLSQLNLQLKLLRRQLDTVNQALLQAEIDKHQQNAEIQDLGKRLNVALAHQVNRLSRYRSAFFEQLTEALQGAQQVRVDGDRFILPTELLFAPGSATLGAEGRQQLGKLAVTLKDIAARIPSDLPWLLRVDGHTDSTPIRSSGFRSNWALSSARALSVVQFLESQGIAARHLLAAGFGEHHPIDPALTPVAYAKNRRIEFKLTQR